MKVNTVEDYEMQVTERYDDSTKLDQYIRTVPNFPEEGIMYQDISPMLEEPDVMETSIEQLDALLEGKDIDVVAGFGARGFIYGPLLAQEQDAPFAMVRKEGKLPEETVSEAYGLEYDDDVIELHTDAVNEGDRVALVDDVLATGGTMEAGTALVERLGGEVAYCATVIELDDLDGRDRLEEQGYEVGSLLRYEEAV